MIFIKGEGHRNRGLVKSHRGNNHHGVGGGGEGGGGRGRGGGGDSITLTCCHVVKAGNTLVIFQNIH